MVTVSPIEETFLTPNLATSVNHGQNSVLIATSGRQRTTKNWLERAMHVETLVIRPLSVLGVTRQILLYGGNIVISRIVHKVSRLEKCLNWLSHGFLIQAIWLAIRICVIFDWKEYPTSNFSLYMVWNNKTDCSRLESQSECGTLHVTCAREPNLQRCYKLLMRKLLWLNPTIQIKIQDLDLFYKGMILIFFRVFFFFIRSASAER